MPKTEINVDGRRRGTSARVARTVTARSRIRQLASLMSCPTATSDRGAETVFEKRIEIPTHPI